MRNALALGIALCTVATAAVRAGAGAQAAPGPDTVVTDKGAVRGTIANGVRTFLGIPYAAPPTGALRFAPPQPRDAWTVTLDAAKPGNVCPQIVRTNPQLAGGVPPQSEDCLNLNVTGPVGSGGALPVMVWVHGGGFQQGGGVFFDATKLASVGRIVVVTINYRQGILGWLTADALDTGDHRIGNYGIEDQIAALRWVQRNIAAFGGDPAKVTLAGESGGAMSVCSNLAAPAARGLFVRAIVESGPCARPWPTVAQQVQKMQAMVANLGCTGSNDAVAACLRAVPLDKVLAVQGAYPGHPFSPSVGAEITEQPRDALGTVPLLLGGNTLELGAYLPSVPKTADDYAAAIAAIYGPNAAAVLAKYPYGAYASGYAALATTATDYSPVLPEVAYCWDVRTFQLKTGTPIYAYEFNDPNAPLSLRLAGSVHGSELQYLFPQYAMMTPYPAKNDPLPAASQPLSETMIRYWTNFVRSGDPNGPGLPHWPAYRNATDVMLLTPGGVRSGFDSVAKHQCAFWNSLGFAQ